MIMFNQAMHKHNLRVSIAKKGNTIFTFNTQKISDIDYDMEGVIGYFNYMDLEDIPVGNLYIWTRGKVVKITDGAHFLTEIEDYIPHRLHQNLYDKHEMNESHGNFSVGNIPDDDPEFDWD